jgi:asparagine synthase (glutamine-hydrolysing)
MIGDAIIGTFFKKNEYNTEYKLGQGAYSLEVIERLSDYQFKQEYENEEIFCLYTRAFTGANQGQTYFQEVTESVSPFCDVDFIEFCYSIPLNLRYNHKIYFDWIFAKHPKAADYIWEKIKKKIEPIENVKPKTMKLFGKQVPAITDKNFSKWLYGSMMRRLGLRKKGNAKKTMVVSTKEHMNPVDYWYQTNPYIKSFMQTYWEENQHYITDDQLKNDMQHLFMDCVLMDKLQALSVLSTIKLIKS